MPSLSPTTRRVLLVAAVLLVIWALVVWVTGGGVLRLGPLRVSSRSVLRPVLGAILLATLAWWRVPRAVRNAEVAQLAAGLDRAAPCLAALTGLALGLTSAVFNEHVAGGADSSGYLHQSYLWSAGRATLPAPVVSGAAWPERGWQVAPLGFAPAVTPDELGPSYAPGLPWLMSLGAAVAGEPGRYIWTPLAAALIVWLTYRLTRRDAPPAVAWAAAVLVATSPALLFASMQTMSDLLCAALWTIAIVALSRSPAPHLPVAALGMAVALVVRPNLVPAAALVGLTAVLVVPGTIGERLRRALVLGVPLAMAAGAIAWINRRLWGSPFSSGYGATDDLFLAAQVPDNLARLWRWTAETHAWWMPAGLLALGLVFVGPGAVAPDRRRRLAPALALVAGVLISYLPYAVFEEWWYLRFYLAAWPVLAMAATTVAWRLGARWSPPIAAIATAVVAVLLTAPAIRVVDDTAVLALWRGAQRYPAVAAWVRANAPAGAVLLGLQHSGALSAAGAATVARYDYVPGGALDASVVALAGTGRATWAVLDDWEEAGWRRRFDGEVRGRLDWAPLAEARVGPARVRIYDLTNPTRAVAPTLVPVVVGGPWPAARQPLLVPAQ